MSFSIQGVGSDWASAWSRGHRANTRPHLGISISQTINRGRSTILLIAKAPHPSSAGLKKEINAVLTSSQKAQIQAILQKAQNTGMSEKQKATFESHLAALKSSGRPGRHHSGGGGGNVSDVPASASDATDSAEMKVSGQSLRNRQFFPSFAQDPSSTQSDP